MGRQGDDRGWDGWMASPTQWRWVWVNDESGSRWWTGRPGLLQLSMGSQGVRHDWVTELNWTERGEIYDGDTIVSLISGAGKTGQLHAKEWK